MTGQQQERSYAYKEADRHGGVHEDYLGGEDDHGNHPIAVLSIRGVVTLMYVEIENHNMCE